VEVSDVSLAPDALRLGRSMSAVEYVLISFFVL